MYCSAYETILFNFHVQEDSHQDSHLDKLIKSINLCEVTFNSINIKHIQDCIYDRPAITWLINHARVFLTMSKIVHSIFFYIIINISILDYFIRNSINFTGSEVNEHKNL